MIKIINFVETKPQIIMRNIKKFLVILVTSMLLSSCDSLNMFDDVNNLTDLVTLNNKMYIGDEAHSAELDLTIDILKDFENLEFSTNANWISNLNFSDGILNFDVEANTSSQMREAIITIKLSEAKLEYTIMQIPAGEKCIDLKFGFKNYSTVGIYSIIPENEEDSYALFVWDDEYINQYENLEDCVKESLKETDWLEKGRIVGGAFPKIFCWWIYQKPNTKYTAVVVYTNEAKELLSPIYSYEIKTDPLPESIPYDLSFNILEIKDTLIKLEFPGLQDIVYKDENGTPLPEIYFQKVAGIVGFFNSNMFNADDSDLDIVNKINNYLLNKGSFLGRVSLYAMCYHSKPEWLSLRSFCIDYLPNTEFLFASCGYYDGRPTTEIDIQRFMTPDFKMPESSPLNNISPLRPKEIECNMRPETEINTDLKFFK